MRHPALALACPFVAGLAVGGHLPAVVGLADLLLVAGATVVALAAATPGVTRRWTAIGLLALASGASIGARDGALRAGPPLRQLMSPHLDGVGAEPVALTGRLRRDAQAGRDGGASLVIIPLVAGQQPVPAISGPSDIRITVGGTPSPAAIARWREGTVVTLPAFLRVAGVYRNPGIEDAALALARRGTGLVGTTKSAALVEVVAPASGIDAWAAGARAWVRASIRRHLDNAPRAAAICLAILIGDRTGLDDDTVDQLRRAGTFHVIAISGGNVALFTVACVVGLRLVRLGPRLASLAAIAVLLAFGAIVERSASVDRALAVAVIYLAARVADHRASPLTVVGVVALASGAVDPAIVFDVGAHLTFGATVGLLAGGSRTAAWMRARAPADWPRRGVVATASRLTGDAVAATLAAEVAVIPISALAFGQVTLAGLVLNLVAIPAMTVVQFAGLTVLVLDATLPSLAAPAAQATAVASDVLVESSMLVEYLPWLVIETPAVAASLRAPPPEVVPPGDASRLVDPVLRVTFLDVGQGDATLVQFPSGASMLVDAGGAAGTGFDIGGRVIVPAVRALGVSRLAWLSLSHGDADHISGGLRVIERLRPREVWEGVPVPRFPGLSEILAAAGRTGAPLRRVIVDEAVRVGGVDVRVLHPPRPDWERQRVRNDDSIVLELRYGDVQLILPGDIGTETERRVVERLVRGGRVVVKAAHHGSRTSSGEAWVTRLRPDAVVFSAGRGNRFGHPAPEVVRRFVSAGSEIFRTDRDGAITVATDGSALWAVTMDGRRWWKRGRQ